jgi:two-component system phosphate regulon response regulator OmpR
MVVDDDLDTVNMLRLVLKSSSYEVTTATSWEEVSDRLLLAEREKINFDLIILDIMMPGRSGFDIFNSIEVVLHPMPPVIFLSAKSSIETMVKASDMGAAKFLAKPTTPDKLLATVRDVLQHGR